jgi:SAM-dependent methyltransferase
VDELLIAKYPDLERDHFWWSTRRALVSRIFGECHPGGAASVLDVGCGSGITSAMLAERGADVVGIDMDLGCLIPPESGVSYVQGDYLKKSPDLGLFDFVVALDSVEHFENELSVMRALAANTRYGGKALVTVPAFDWLWTSLDDQNTHYRRYTRRRLAGALETAGFEIDRVGYIFPTLIAPKAAITLVERLRSKPGPTGTDVVGWVNDLAEAYFQVETRVGASFKNFWPFGSSVVALATRRQE